MKSRSKKQSVPPALDIFEAARAGEVERVRACLEAGADPKAVNNRGFTALHCAAAGADETPIDKNLAVLKLLLTAGSPLEHPGRDGRTALYLAAEFSPKVDAVQLLLDSGAQIPTDPNFLESGVMAPAVKKLLTRLLGQPTPKRIPSKKSTATKMSAEEWRAAKKTLDAVFDSLSNQGLVVLQNAGTTQDDGFADCTEEWHKRGGKEARLKGFCFYTSQDLRRAKAIRELSLAFWGAPTGTEKAMRQIGTLISKAFEKAGFRVEWNRTGGERPNVFL